MRHRRRFAQRHGRNEQDSLSLSLFSPRHSLCRMNASVRTAYTQPSTHERTHACTHAHAHVHAHTNTHANTHTNTNSVSNPNVFMHIPPKVNWMDSPPFPTLVLPPIAPTPLPSNDLFHFHCLPLCSHPHTHLAQVVLNSPVQRVTCLRQLLVSARAGRREPLRLKRRLGTARALEQQI
jgi:hypothetical protein